MIPTDKNLSYYYGVRKFIKEKSLMNMDMIFDIYPKQIYPFRFLIHIFSQRCIVNWLLQTVRPEKQNTWKKQKIRTG